MLGLLHSDQTIDMERTKELVELARPWRSRFTGPSMFLLIWRNRSRLSYDRSDTCPDCGRSSFGSVGCGHGQRTP